MKIKVDENEWKELKERVESLEASRDSDRHYDREYHIYLRDHLQEMMEDFFRNKVQTYMLKRDKDMIIAELKSQAIDNIFKEEE